MWKGRKEGRKEGRKKGRKGRKRAVKEKSVGCVASTVGVTVQPPAHNDDLR